MTTTNTTNPTIAELVERLNDPSLTINATHTEQFIASVLATDEIIGRKQATERGCLTTGEAIMKALPSGMAPIQAAKYTDVGTLLFTFKQLHKKPLKDFEANVVRHTLDAFALGRVVPSSAGFVAWAGKVLKDHLAVEAAKAEAASTPTGKASFTATYDGIRAVQTSFGLKAVHAFTTECGKKLEWWTDLKASDVDAQGNLLPVPTGEQVNLNCRIKGSSIWQGKLSYKITHAKWVPAT